MSWLIHCLKMVLLSQIICVMFDHMLVFFINNFIYNLKKYRYAHARRHMEIDGW